MSIPLSEYLNQETGNTDRRLELIQDRPLSVVLGWYEEYRGTMKDSSEEPSLPDFVRQIRDRNMLGQLGAQILGSDPEVELSRLRGLAVSKQHEVDAKGNQVELQSAPIYVKYPALSRLSTELTQYASRDVKNAEGDSLYAATTLGYTQEIQRLKREKIASLISNIVCDEGSYSLENLAEATLNSFLYSKMIDSLTSDILTMSDTMKNRAVGLHRWQGNSDNVNTSMLLLGCGIGIGVNLLAATGTKAEIPAGLLIAIVGAGTSLSLTASKAGLLWTKFTDSLRRRAHESGYNQAPAIQKVLRTFEQVNLNLGAEDIFSMLNNVELLKVNFFCDAMEGPGSITNDDLVSQLQNEIYMMARSMMVFDHTSPNTSNAGTLLGQLVAVITATVVVNYAAAHIDAAKVQEIIGQVFGS